MDINASTLDEVFKFHRATPEQIAQYDEINSATKAAAAAVLKHCPPSRERSLALTAIQDAKMWANTAISVNQPSDKT